MQGLEGEGSGIDVAIAVPQAAPHPRGELAAERESGLDGGVHDGPVSRTFLSTQPSLKRLAQSWGEEVAIVDAPEGEVKKPPRRTPCQGACRKAWAKQQLPFAKFNVAHTNMKIMLDNLLLESSLPGRKGALLKLFLYFGS